MSSAQLPFLRYNVTGLDGVNDPAALSGAPLEAFYTNGDIAWLITASALVWLMLPGVGFFYSGLTGQKSALSMIMLSFIAMSVGTVQVRATYNEHPCR